jgi:lipopolysaccharide transport system ATP-binding protein
MTERPPDRLKHSIVPKLQRLIGNPPKQYYREFWALKDISFNVKRGETIGIIGRNGSGKSTLLQLICGTLAPTSGSVETNGRVAALLELGSGFNPEFTGRENVFMNGAILGLSLEEVEARFADIIAFADIGDFIEQPVKTYSSGMVMRLAFAVAINVDPQVLVVDEALSVGDERFQRKCFSRIEAIKKGGSTILFVSHSGSTVIELCDAAMLIDSGELLSTGAPKAIVGEYQKLLYAPHTKLSTIRDEIRSSICCPSLQNDKIDIWQTDMSLEGVRSSKTDREEFFDPNLVPQSTVAYESQGAYIESPEIHSLGGRKVNCIVRGRKYLYTYKVSFRITATNVRFGMLIKTVSGLELGGGVSAPTMAQAIPHIAQDSEAHVEFGFTVALNPGTYFLNAGVIGLVGAEEVFLHRILDACMFVVLPIADSLCSGPVYYSVIPKVILNTDVRCNVEK